MNTDYSYCSGVTCPIRKDCKRYLPNPPDIRLWWIPPAYKQENKQCPHYEPAKNNENGNQRNP